MRQTLLDLQAPGEHLDQAGDLGEPDNLPVRQIADMTFAEERHQVVLAEGIEFNVFDDDHIVTLGFKDRLVQNGRNVLLVALGEIAERLSQATLDGC